MQLAQLKPSSGPVATTEAYDTASVTWSAASAMSTPCAWHTVTPLGNGKLLVSGGSSTHNASGTLSTTELYSP